MAKRTPVKASKVQVAFEALSIEGGLLSPEWLSKIAQLQADAQAQADYKVPKGLTLRDEIGRYWRIAEALWGDYRAKSEGLADATKATEDFLTTFFRQCLGFNDLHESQSIAIGERVYPVGHCAGNGQIPIVISSPHESLDTLATRFGEDHRKRTAFGLLQEYLNGSDKVLWGIVCDGETLRIVRDNASLTKPAWIEADLKRMFQEARYADFAAFWLVCHRSRFGEASQPPSDCILERWRNSCRTEGTRARDHLRVGVEEALEILGQGFIANAENTNLREILQAGSLSTQVYFQELLRLVYRIIFLVTIEERGLLHPAQTVEKIKELYEAGYSIRRLRDRSIRRNTFDKFSDLWESLKIVFKGIGVGEERLGLPALGGLFGNDQTPTLMAAKIENRFLLQAVLKLCWLKEESGVSRVNWRDMGPEELGSVYESLLELVPQVSDGGRKFSFARGDETAGNARKLSGSYYTPDELVQSLLDTALEPVVSSTIKANINDPVPALLALTIIDPACGSAHFLLAAARRLAGHVARLQVGGTPSAQEYRKALRQVISHCIYGVDKNPMALELARMALWLEAMSPDAPLSFLDHHLVCGDALLGILDFEVMSTGIPVGAFTALNGDDKEICKSVGSENAKKLKELKSARGNEISSTLFDLNNFNLLPMLKNIELMSDETADAIELKKIALENYLAVSSTASISIAADMFTCAFLAPKNADTKSLIPTTGDLLRSLRGTLPNPSVLKFIKTLAVDNRILHWKLKFPQVFAKGGFDVVLGNPPWEMMQTDPREFFAAHVPEIANSESLGATEDLINSLKESNPHLYFSYLERVRATNATQEFVHSSRRFPLTSFGRINLAPLFAETALQIASKKAMVGLVLPSGIVFDSFNRHFFAHISDGRLVSVFSFEEVRQWFPGTDDRRSFCLITLGKSKSTNFAFGLCKIEELTVAGKVFQLNSTEIAAINPNTLTCPIFRSQYDANLTKKIYSRIPVLWNESIENGNPWGISFMLMFMMNTDSRKFRKADKRNELKDPTPLYEAKMMHLYDHRWATHVDGSFRDATEAEKAKDTWEAEPRYWIEKGEVERKLEEKGWKHEWLIGWRDVTLSTVERTVIASILPRVGISNSLPLMFPSSEISTSEICALLANWCSLVFDYVARQKVGGTHLNFFIVKQLPVIPPAAYSPDNIEFIVERVKQLVCTSKSLDPFASELNWAAPLVQADVAEQAKMRAELDAYFFALYGLSREEVIYVLNPMDVVGADYPTETFRVLMEWELKQLGEYRTKRLILESWDELEILGKLPNPVRMVT